MCTIGTLSPKASANIVIAMQAKKSGEVTNTAFVTTSGVDPKPANNTVTATSRIVPLVAPLGKGRLYGTINKAWPTIVLTHGLAIKSDYDQTKLPKNLWISNKTDEQARGAGTLLAGKLKELNQNVNVLQFVWDEAFQVDGLIPTRSEYIAARNGTYNAGNLLANLLLENLGSNYDKDIHFIGHSLGTVVCAYAAGHFLSQGLQVTKAQFTALDRPHYVHKIPGTGFFDDEKGKMKFNEDKGFNSSFFAKTLETWLANRPNLKLTIDNYFTYSGLEGVGETAGPAIGILIYNHPQLINPNDVGGRFFENENTGGYDNDHNGVEQWYRLTINTDLYKDVLGKPICDGAKFNKPTFWDKTLNPCQMGWYWSINGPNPAALPGINNVVSPIKSTDKTLALSGYKNIQGSQQQGNSFALQTSTTAIATSNNKTAGNVSNAIASANAFATINVDLPAGTNYLTFDYKFSNIGDGDYAAVSIGDNPIWSLAGANYTGQDFVSSGPIPINGYKDAITLTLALYGTGVTNTKVEFRNFAGIAVNSPPVFEQLSSYTVATGNLLTIAAKARDENGDAITFSLSGAPDGATIDPLTGEFSWIPSGTQFGNISFKMRVTDNSADQLFAEQTVNVLVLDTAGYEADVAPRPNGNKTGTVTIAGWVQLGRFAAGLDTPEIGSEFQRADNAPRSTFGDGKITLADWVQGGRYAAGLDTVNTVGGAFAPLDSAFVSITPEAQTEATRTIRAVNTAFQRGQLGTLQIVLDGQGNENAVAFSLNFDPKQLSFVDATVSSGTNGAALQVNKSQAANGHVGFALALPAGQQLAAGTRTLLTLRFIPNGGDGDVVTNISFSDQLMAREIVDAFATPIPQVSYAGGTITVHGRAAANVSAASYVEAELAADSIASAFGTGLATMTAGAVSLPLPNTLGGTSVKVKDALGVERNAPLFFVSPNQINYQIPAGTADGIASVTITNGLGEVTAGLMNIARVAPGLFAADASGKGWAAAEVVSVASDGSQTLSPVARFDAGQNKFVALPIDVQTNGAVLVLYGTGLRQRSDLANVKVKVGGTEAAVEFAGAQASYAGLDQVNVRLPKSLAGRGEVMVELMIEGKAANPLRILVK